MPAKTNHISQPVLTLAIQPLASLAELETVLAQGRLQALMANGNWWTLRRNGATRRWVRDKGRFEIPAKAGLRTYLTLTPAALTSPYLRIQPEA
ncbi:MAG TPA: hypothetical protein VMT20_15380 [Terriglobia bacterium]|nr:hypothetical protein [Terriglobia bacterium]